jgi:hypothetical protein
MQNKFTTAFSLLQYGVTVGHLVFESLILGYHFGGLAKHLVMGTLREKS